MLKIYLKQDVAQERIDEIVVESGDNGQELTYSQLCYDKRYRRATWVGCVLALLQ